MAGENIGNNSGDPNIMDSATIARLMHSGEPARGGDINPPSSQELRERKRQHYAIAHNGRTRWEVISGGIINIPLIAFMWLDHSIRHFNDPRPPRRRI